MYGADSQRQGPVSGIKQKILEESSKSVVLEAITITDLKEGVYLAMMYENGPEFLRSQIEEKDLKMKKKFEEGIDYINRWWKRQAIKRYTKLYDSTD